MAEKAQELGALGAEDRIGVRPGVSILGVGSSTRQQPGWGEPSPDPHLTMSQQEARSGPACLGFPFFWEVAWSRSRGWGNDETEAQLCPVPAAGPGANQKALPTGSESGVLDQLYWHPRACGECRLSGPPDLLSHSCLVSTEQVLGVRRTIQEDRTDAAVGWAEPWEPRGWAFNQGGLGVWLSGRALAWPWVQSSAPHTNK